MKKSNEKRESRILGIEQQGTKTVEVIGIFVNGEDTGQRMYRRIITNRIHEQGLRAYKS